MPDRRLEPEEGHAFSRTAGGDDAALFLSATPVSIIDRRGTRTIELPDLTSPARSQPLVSCLMVTRGRLTPTRHAIACFLNQTYSHRELIIVDDSADSPVAAFVEGLADKRIRHVRLRPTSQTLGELRNLAVANAAGDVLCQWDDDDLYDPLRIALSVKSVHAGQAAAVFLKRELLWWPRLRRLSVSGPRAWEGSMLVVRDALPKYPPLRRREDRVVTQAILHSCRVVLLDRPALYCYNVTGQNTWGERHFETIFSRASVCCLPTEYDRALEALDRRIPVRAFERDLAAPPSLSATADVFARV